MPVGESGYPVLSHFLCSVANNTGMPLLPLTSEQDAETAQHAGGDTRKQLPKGVVLGPDGKPYVSCQAICDQAAESFPGVAPALPLARGRRW